jgi:hypothetical protein
VLVRSIDNELVDGDEEEEEEEEDSSAEVDDDDDVDDEDIAVELASIDLKFPFASSITTAQCKRIRGLTADRLARTREGVISLIRENISGCNRKIHAPGKDKEKEVSTGAMVEETPAISYSVKHREKGLIGSMQTTAL